MTGVMPIIFANSIVAIPATIASFMNSNNGFVKFINGDWGFVNNIQNAKLQNVVRSLISFNYSGWIYTIVFLALLIAFAYFYVAISFNPVEVANNIKNNGGAIPGIRSGRPTVEFIKKVLNRITLVGALLVAFIAVFPMMANIVASYFGSAAFMTLAFSGSSMMIVVGVALETVRELEAQMSLRNYKGFLD
jgi:preprotein translocase subunit SecY